jgi:hypothetical protein
MSQENDIIQYFLRTNKGIRATARHFGVTKSYAGAIISRYIKTHNIRF